MAISLHYLLYKPDNYYDIEGGAKRRGADSRQHGPRFDLMRYLIGEIVKIQVMTANKARGFEVEDTAVVNVRFDNGTIGSITLSDAGVSP